jgi:hypothetical protein
MVILLVYRPSVMCAVFDVCRLSSKTTVVVATASFHTFRPVFLVNGDRMDKVTSPATSSVVGSDGRAIGAAVGDCPAHTHWSRAAHHL